MLQYQARFATISAWHANAAADRDLVVALAEYIADTRATLVHVGISDDAADELLVNAVQSINKQLWAKPPSGDAIAAAVRRVLLRECPSFAADVRAKQLIVKRWGIGEISSFDLINSFSLELLAIIRHVDIDHAAAEYLAYLEVELDRRRSSDNPPLPLSGVATFISWALSRFRSRRDEFEHPVNPPILAPIPLVKPPPPLTFGDDWRDIAIRNPAYVPYKPYPRSPDEKPEYEASDLTLTIPELASIVESVPADHQDVVRLLTLRVVGGWSLREIAKRDGVPLDRIAERWVAARTWLERQSSQRVGRIVTFDLFDLHLLETLLRDQRLASAVDWRTFEKLLASIVEALGYEVELQQGTKDGGIDVLALKRDAVFGPHRYLLQAKRWSARVGVEPVRELLFLREHYKATKACLATTSTFTAGAWQLAGEYRWQLELRDYQRLADWVELLKPGL